jgi:hypothetical protein
LSRLSTCETVYALTIRNLFSLWPHPTVLQVVVILIRTVKYNLSKLRDVYLHTNCLAALANMAPHVQQLNAYASQRLVSLFDMLARKYVNPLLNFRYNAQFAALN